MSLPCDYVVLAVGARPNLFDVQALEDKGYQSRSRRRVFGSKRFIKNVQVDETSFFRIYMKQSICERGCFFAVQKGIGDTADKDPSAADDRGTSGGGSRMSVCRRVSAQSLYSGGSI